eukprot:4020068-Prymnesium_polylepis.2
MDGARAQDCERASARQPPLATQGAGGWRWGADGVVAAWSCGLRRSQAGGWALGGQGLGRGA